MAVTTQMLIEKIPLSSDEPIQLISLFPEEVKDGKLHLDKIDFFALGPTLCNIDFANCIITNSDFECLIIEDCDFTNCEFSSSNATKDTFIDESVKFHANTILSNIAENCSLNGESWFKKMWQERPQDIFNYDKLEKWVKLDKIRYEKPFFRFKYPDNELDAGGWKLHLSVDPTHFKQAFNLVTPIISRYHVNFKFADINKGDADLETVLSKMISHADFEYPFHHSGLDQLIESFEHLKEEYKKKKIFESNDEFSVNLRSMKRTYEGMQITVYLKNKTNILSYNQTSQMINEINDILAKNEISPGKIADSEARLISPYCSIRNDKFFIPKFFTNLVRHQKSTYLSFDEVGTNFNPTNLPNLYADLLLNKQCFDLLENFRTLPLKSEENIFNALICSLLAYLHEYTEIDILNGEKLEEFIVHCFQDNSSITEFIKNSEKETHLLDQDIKTIVKMLCRLTSFTEEIKFSLDYPLGNKLRDLINLYNTTLVNCPKYFSYGIENEEIDKLENFSRLTQEELYSIGDPPAFS